jgi:transcriptional regulator with GAF, ATPase, and Fis domain
MTGAPNTEAAGAATFADEEQAAAFVLPERGVNLEDLERQLVVQALERCGWNQTRAATLLGLNRDQVRYRIEKFGLTAPGPRTTLNFSSTR